MSAITVVNSDTPPQHALVPAEETAAAGPLPVETYDLLTEFHLDRISSEGGKPRSCQHLKNQRSNVSRWVEFNGLSPASPVGEELGVMFAPTLAEFLSHLEVVGNKKQTILDRKSTVHQLRESYVEFKRNHGLPKGFGEALCVLISLSGGEAAKVARRAGVVEDTLRDWARGSVTPCVRSLKTIRRLEDYFKVPRGTLSARLPDALWAAKSVERGTTEWRRHQAEMLKLRYKMKALPPHVQADWDEVLCFFTDEDWVAERSMRRGSAWRIRWNTGRCETGHMRHDMLLSYFGYLLLPETSGDRRMRGLGYTADELSLKLVGDAKLVKSYLRFVKARTVSQSHNSFAIVFLGFALQLLRPHTGYLWQSSRYAPHPTTPKQWRAWCERNFKELEMFREAIKEGLEGNFRKTRDPYAGVREIIERRQHPISALFEVVRKQESLIPILERSSAIRLATHCRDIFFLRFIGSNPLRVENFSMMTFIPRNWEEFQRSCETYRDQQRTDGRVTRPEIIVETDSVSNLYQRADGSWWLRFDERDFKNERGEDLENGILNAPYDVMIVPSVWPALQDYLFRHRPVLNLRLKAELNAYREKNNVPLLTPVEEMEIERCRYVFRPSLHTSCARNLAHFTGVSQMNRETLTYIVHRLTQKFLPGCPGFGAHACRHLVATEYLKNRPDGEAVAAAALHNTVPVVRKYYDWVKPGDKMKHWNDYHEDLLGKYESGVA